MIVDKLANAASYAVLHENLRAALEFLQKTDLSTLPPGRREIMGEDVYAMVLEYQTKRKAQGKWEAHRRYTDVQYILQGMEQMGYANVSDLQISQDYDPEKDILFLAGEGSFITVRPGTFVVFDPQDAHMPGIALRRPAAVRKIVVKVRK